MKNNHNAAAAESSSPPSKRLKGKDGNETPISSNTGAVGTAAVLLNLKPSTVIQDAAGNQAVQEKILDFCNELKTKITTAINSETEATKDTAMCTECAKVFLAKTSLTPCTCYFQEDDFSCGVLLCPTCLTLPNKDDKYKQCIVCQQLLCKNKDGCDLASCGDCTNVMCQIHFLSNTIQIKKCMCGKKLWCPVCSKSIDAQVKSGLTTDCDSCHGVACGFAECTIYKTCRTCYKRLCENCVYRPKCDCDETLPLCDTCEAKYTCPNPNCPGPAQDPASILLAELAD